MAPEQARGRAADKRSDVWAFGCVLYEMLTGRRPFDGEDVTDTIAAVMRGEPHWNALPTQTPAAIRRLLRRCLAKDRSRRLADIAAHALSWKTAGMRPPSVRRTNEPRADRSHRLALAVGGWIAAFVLAVFPARLYLGRAGTELATWRMDIVAPSATDSSSFALSSNGRKLAFVATQGGQRLWVRALDEIAAQPIPGTDGASFPCRIACVSASESGFARAPKFELTRSSAVGGTRRLRDYAFRRCLRPRRARRRRREPPAHGANWPSTIAGVQQRADVADKSANHLAEARRAAAPVSDALRAARTVGAEFELGGGMSGYDGRDRRKNPSNPMVRSWRRALQNEWEADKRRREKHRDQPPRDRAGADERVDGQDAGDEPKIAPG
jgi:Protein kinase domain